MTAPGWLSPTLPQDFALLRRWSLSVDPMLLCYLPTVPRALDHDATTWASQAKQRYWSTNLRLQIFDAVPLPGDLPGEALHTAFLNSAALMGLFGGALHPERKKRLVQALTKRLDAFLNEVGLPPLLRAFVALRAYEHGRVLVYYGQMEQEAFADCRHHLPAHPNYGTLDLLHGTACGLLESVVVDDKVLIGMADAGRLVYERLRDVLSSVGVIALRAQLVQQIR